MNYPSFAQPGIFPEGRLHHLVLAACGEGNTDAAWRAYAETLADDYPNEGELRLFALVADRLSGALGSQPLAKYLESSRRWARMQAMINNNLAKELGAVFLSENIPLMWTKGTALVDCTDGRKDLRPSSDLDGLFKWQDVERILELAEKQGWETKLGLHKNRARARFTSPELSFRIGQRGQLDLQWQPRLPFKYDQAIQAWLWEDPSRISDENGTTNASHTWLLIETIEHGLNANTVYPIRWVVDAVRLLAARHQEIDWPAFTEIVMRNKLHYSFGVGLRTIAQYSPHIPPSVLERIEGRRAGFLDRAEFRMRVSAVDMGQGYFALGALNQLRREPSISYYKSPPNPLNRESGLSVPVRLAIAGRNVATRLLFPLWYLKR